MFFGVVNSVFHLSDFFYMYSESQCFFSHFDESYCLVFFCIFL